MNELLEVDKSILLILDMQEKLLKRIVDNDSITNKIIKIIEVCNILGCEIICTEQNPEKLGITVGSIRDLISKDPLSKMTFSCAANANILKTIKKNSNKKDIILCGIETHICILQSALELISLGYRVYVVIDATSSRSLNEKKIAESRLISSSINLLTVESLIFEWCRTAERKEFKELSSIVKELDQKRYGQ